jgi:putative tricarboxylic transport membrane protein
MTKDIILSGIIIGASVFFYTLTFQFQQVPGFEKMGPDFWPRLTLIGVVFLSLVILLRSLRGRQRDAEPNPGQEEKKNIKGVFICGIILFCFLFFISYLGFLITAFICTGLLIYALGERNKLVIVATSLGMVTVIYIIFGKLMYVPMPRGVSLFEKLSYYLY